jgi:starch synthase
MKKTKVLFAVSEVSPFAATGGMGQVAAALPHELLKLAKSGQSLEIAVVCPLYSNIKRQFSDELTFVGATSAVLSWRNQYVGVFSAARDGVTYYFVDNQHYFGRDNLYGYFDDGERFAFFCKAVFAVIELTGFKPDVIHAHDWQTALIPLYLKTRFAAQYSNTRSVFTIHNLEYQGQFAPEILFDVFDLYEYERGLVEWNNCINLMKGAIVTCDKLTTVSPTYAIEIQNGGGHGLESILHDNNYKLTGIINGIDTELYNPATDNALFRNYTVKTLEDKAANKRKLQELFGLRVDPKVPLLCMVSRLVTHKGIDLIRQIAQDLSSSETQFLILGTGDPYYEWFFNELAAQHPDKVGASITFNIEISSMIYAGADITLVPSMAEPCGLTQMISCRYGTIPIVRETGGLKDTIRDCRLGEGNGFTFIDYNAGVLLYTIRKALELYRSNGDNWRKLMIEAMNSDFSWRKSAERYLELYGEIL